MSTSSGHQGKAVEKQRSGLEDEAEEKHRNQDDDKAPVMQRCTQVDEDVGKRWSIQGDEAQEKQRRSLRRCSARADEDTENPGLDHPGQNKKERPKHNDNKMRKKQTRRPGL